MFFWIFFSINSYIKLLMLLPKQLYSYLIYSEYDLDFMRLVKMINARINQCWSLKATWKLFFNELNAQMEVE